MARRPRPTANDRGAAGPTQTGSAQRRFAEIVTSEGAVGEAGTEVGEVMAVLASREVKVARRTRHGESERPGQEPGNSV